MPAIRIIARLAILFAALPAVAGPLATAPVERVVTPLEVRLDGVVQAVRRSTVAAQTGGRVERVLVDVDDYVDKGEVLIELTDREQRASVRQAEAELAAARARFAEARDSHRRTADLLARKLASQAQMDQAEAALKTATAAIDAAQAALEQAREQLGYTRVHAPYSGVVTARHVEPGEVAQPGQPLMTGLSLEQLRVEVEVPQGFISGIREQRQAEIELPGGERVAANAVTVFPLALEGSNSFRVRVQLPEEIRGLFPGMFVKVAFTIGEREVLAVPQQAVVFRSEVTGVYVVADGRIALRQIRLGRALADGHNAVLAGLAEGERIALDPIAAGAALKAQGRAGDE